MLSPLLQAAANPASAALPAETRFLNPGDWAVGGNGDVFGTLLGSCVALVLWYPMMRVGALCHYVLPNRDERMPASDADARYGVDAFRLMERALANRGITLAQCTAKLFGGARVYEAPGGRIDVGSRNVDCAHEFLNARHLPLAAENTGGVGWRRLCFDAGSGEVWMRFNTQRMQVLPRNHEAPA
jgi:chemotaxis protein CheD